PERNRPMDDSLFRRVGLRRPAGLCEKLADRIRQAGANADAAVGRRARQGMPGRAVSRVLARIEDARRADAIGDLSGRRALHRQARTPPRHCAPLTGLVPRTVGPAEGTSMIVERRPLGTTGIQISPIALGCWPIAGITSVGVTEANSLATIERCFDLGINFLDTAYCYGRDGESERLIRRAIGSRRNEMVIATKGGIHWGPD